MDNTIIVMHRINSINELKRIKPKYGVEIDIRGFGNKLLLSHDPLDENKISEYDNLEEYLKYYKHRFIIINLKEAGYEKKIIEILKEYEIENYFLLDVEFPFIYEANKIRFKKIAIRFSEIEPIELSLKQQNKLEWVWIDTMTKIILTKENYELLKSFKKAIVCPGRWGRKEDIKKYKELILKNNFKIELIMTDKESLKYWENES